MGVAETITRSATPVDEEILGAAVTIGKDAKTGS